eukprot:3365669-Heterocapsa_arctica.AAC.1
MGEHVEPLGPAVLSELRVATALVLVAEYDAQRPTSDHCYVSDSSCKGFALWEGFLDPAEVGDTSKWRERR